METTMDPLSPQSVEDIDVETVNRDERTNQETSSSSTTGHRANQESSQASAGHRANQDPPRSNQTNQNNPGVHPIKTFQYLSIGHFPCLSESINNLRKKGRFCDVTISIGDNRFRAHKVILASSSEFFASLFEKDRESAETLIHLDDPVKANGFEPILDFFYTSVLTVESSALLDVLSVASFLQLHQIVHKCCDFMKDLHKVAAASSAAAAAAAAAAQSPNFPSRPPPTQLGLMPPLPHPKSAGPPPHPLPVPPPPPPSQSPQYSGGGGAASSSSATGPIHVRGAAVGVSPEVASFHSSQRALLFESMRLGLAMAASTAPATTLVSQDSATPITTPLTGALPHAPSLPASTGRDAAASMEASMTPRDVADAAEPRDTMRAPRDKPASRDSSLESRDASGRESFVREQQQKQHRLLQQQHNFPQEESLDLSQSGRPFIKRESSSTLEEAVSTTGGRRQEIPAVGGGGGSGVGGERRHCPPAASQPRSPTRVAEAARGRGRKRPEEEEVVEDEEEVTEEGGRKESREDSLQFTPKRRRSVSPSVETIDPSDRRASTPGAPQPFPRPLATPPQQNLSAPRGTPPQRPQDFQQQQQQQRELQQLQQQHQRPQPERPLVSDPTVDSRAPLSIAEFDRLLPSHFHPSRSKSSASLAIVPLHSRLALAPSGLDLAAPPSLAAPPVDAARNGTPPPSPRGEPATPRRPEGAEGSRKPDSTGQFGASYDPEPSTSMEEDRQRMQAIRQQHSLQQQQHQQHQQNLRAIELQQFQPIRLDEDGNEQNRADDAPSRSSSRADDDSVHAPTDHVTASDRDAVTASVGCSTAATTSSTSSSSTSSSSSLLDALFASEAPGSTSEFTGSGAQLRFHSLVRNAAEKADIWSSGIRVRDITTDQAGVFFEEIFVKAPDLRPFKEQVWKKLCSKLKGRRQYLNQLSRRKQSAGQPDQPS